jgi:hypothetical protein
MMEMRPSSPLSSGPQTKPVKSFAQRAGTLSRWIFLLAVLIIGPAFLALDPRTNERQRWLLVAACIAGGSVSLGGVLWAFAGLLTLERGEPRRNLWRALAGIIANGLLVAITVMAILNITKPTALPSGTSESASSQNTELMMKTLLADLNLRQKRMQRVAETGQGDVALIAQVSAKLLQRQQSIIENCYAAFGPVKNGHLLNMANVERPEELAEREESVRNFAAAYRQLRDFSTNVENIYRVELEQSGVSMEPLKRALQTFHNNSMAANRWWNQLGAANSRWAEAELAALDLLGTNWGKWTYDQDLRKVQFQDKAQAEVFNRLVREINDSRRLAEQTKHQVLKQQ